MFGDILTQTRYTFFDKVW